MANIIKDYKWTTTTGNYLEEVPRVFAKSYQITTNEALDSIENWIKATANFTGGYSKYYNRLHKFTVGSEEQWVFPFFDDKVRSFTNEWGDSLKTSTDGSVSYGAGVAEGVSSFIKNVATTSGVLQSMGPAFLGLNAKPGSLFEPPKFYQYSASDSALTVDFVLINTEAEKDAEKNYEVVKKLIEQNRFSRVSGLTVSPARLWSVTVPGYRAIRWASCNVDVSLLGKRLFVNSKLMPEGYRVSLSFTSLYTEPREFMGDVTKNESL